MKMVGDGGSFVRPSLPAAADAQLDLDGRGLAAVDCVLDRRIVVKLLASGADRDRFEREARAVAVLGHPNIVELFDFGRNRAGFMVFEYLDRRSRQHPPCRRQPATDDKRRHCDCSNAYDHPGVGAADVHCYDSAAHIHCDYDSAAHHGGHKDHSAVRRQGGSIPAPALAMVSDGLPR
jgi:hypothetical protein